MKNYKHIARQAESRIAAHKRQMRVIYIGFCSDNSRAMNMKMTGRARQGGQPCSGIAALNGMVIQHANRWPNGLSNNTRLQIIAAQKASKGGITWLVGEQVSY